MPELVFFRRGDEVLRFALERKRVVLGRGERCDLQIPDPDASRQHLALTWDGESLRLEDLSGHGTLVKGEPVREGVVEDGADIRIGHYSAVFRVNGAPLVERPTGRGQSVTHAVDEGAPARRFQPAQLRVRRGAEETVVRLSDEVFTIGSDPQNDLVLEDRFVSARHVRIARRAGLFQLIDNRSTNGTWIGGVRVFEVEVQFGTTFRVGDAELVLEPVQRRERGPFQGIIGTDPSVRQLVDLIERVAPSSAAVAVFGESGTGKELVARALHDLSPRAARGFIPVNCAAISRELIESELFGHEKGAFTGAIGASHGAFEEADGGTIFLDEIGELSLDLQAKLLRVLESGEIKRVGASRPSHVNVRVVAATNRDLLDDVRQGRFREDLYYRLCVIPLHLPPLRSRRNDVVAIAEHFVAAFAPEGQNVGLTASAVERLKGHHWPGNVRELRNVVHRALLLRKGPMIDSSDITFDREFNADAGVAVPEPTPGLTLEQMLRSVERQIVESALRRYQNNRARVARELDISTSTLFQRLRDWGLTRPGEAD